MDVLGRQGVQFLSSRCSMTNTGKAPQVSLAAGVGQTCAWSKLQDRVVL